MMVEVIENLQIEDSDISVENISSLEVVETLPNSTNDFNSKQAELKKINEITFEEPQLPPSKWTSLTRAFQLGLAIDAHPTSSKPLENSMQCEMKSQDTKGPLRKMFRQGLPKFQNRPTSGNQVKKSEIEMSQSSTETLPLRKAKWNIFKTGKSHHHMPQLQVDDENVVLKDEEKKRSLRRIFRLTSRNPKGDQDKTTESVGERPVSECVPSTERRGHSLGKFFRYSKNPPILNNFANCPDEL